MNTKQLSNLFAGATKSQYEKLDRQNKCEIEYMDYVSKNRNKSIKEYEDKYKEIKKKYKLI